MTTLSGKSPGTSTRQINQTGPTSIIPLGIPAGVIGTAKAGPAFVPTTVPTPQDFVVKFGTPGNNVANGPLAALQWLKNAQALTYVRVLGAGTGLDRTADGNNAGRVAGAGFVVGQQLPQNTLGGNYGANAFANLTGPPGRMFVLGCWMTQSAQSTIFADAGLHVTSERAVPIVRGLLMAPSGVHMTLSQSFVTPTSSLAYYTAPSSAPASTYAVNLLTITGSQIGSVNLAGGRQEFVILLNGHKGTDPGYPNVLTCSFDQTAPNYLGTMLNQDPSRIEEAGHYLYARWDIHPSLAAVTGSGVVLGVSGAGAPTNATTGFEKCAFLTTGSQLRNVGTATAPDLENFEDRYQTARTPWVISQQMGGKYQNLFQVWSLEDGNSGNTRFKISIENPAPSLTDTYQYGTFDLVVRDFRDTDKNKAVLETFRGVSLDPSNEKFIGSVIGTQNTFYNWDAAEEAQRLVTDGDYPNKSRYIRVVVNDAILNGEMEPTALPFGFRGIQHLTLTGSSPLPAASDPSIFQAPANLNQAVEVPAPFRRHLLRGPAGNQSPDKGLYWGFQYEAVTSSQEPNASSVVNSSVPSYVQYYPRFHTAWMNLALMGNEGTLDTAANGILDADRYHNNLFALDKIRVKYNSAGLADTTQLVSWSYVRGGSISDNGSTRALAVTDLVDPSVRTCAKFNLPMMGGYDGTLLFNSSSVYLTNDAVVEEMNNSARGGAQGPTVTAYTKALRILEDSLETDIQLLAMPGIRHQYVTDTAFRTVETRFDAMAIMDPEQYDLDDVLVTTETQDVSVRNTVTRHRNRGLNTSFGAVYFPDLNIRDLYSNTVRRVPPSVAVLGAFARNDALAHPWFAPAGFTRGALEDVTDTNVALSRDNMDDLYSIGINPVVGFPGSDGPVIWGQKTLLATASALERVNVRRLLIALRRRVRSVGNRMVFEPTRASTLERFSNLVKPILKDIQSKKGLQKFLVQIDTTTTTEADIENLTIRGVIKLIPTKSLETIGVDFVLTNNVFQV